jgi:hypothetical protein
MMNNNQYNLMTQMVQEHKSLWRIKNNYVKDAADSVESQNFWQKMITDKENHIKELETLIKASMM